MRCCCRIDVCWGSEIFTKVSWFEKTAHTIAACRRFVSTGGRGTTSRRRHCRRSLTAPLSASSWRKLQVGGRGEGLRMRRKQNYDPHDVHAFHADGSGMYACCRAGSGGRATTRCSCATTHLRCGCLQSLALAPDFPIPSSCPGATVRSDSLATPEQTTKASTTQQQ